MSKPKKNTRTIGKIQNVKLGRCSADGFILKFQGYTPKGNPIEIHLVMPWSQNRTW